MANDLMLVEEVAHELRTPVATVRWWIHTGKLKATRPGRRLLVRRSEVERLLASATVSSGTASAAPAPLRVVPSELDRKRAQDIRRRLGLTP
jgi:excisionase family DNA binding protein